MLGRMRGETWVDKSLAGLPVMAKVESGTIRLGHRKVTLPLLLIWLAGDFAVTSQTVENVVQFATLPFLLSVYVSKYTIPGWNRKITRPAITNLIINLQAWKQLCLQYVEKLSLESFKILLNFPFVC